MMRSTSLNFLPMVLLALGLGSPLAASQVRVNAVGGLTLVLEDETEDVNPFVFGNPAGLMLLPHQSRFDLNAPWTQETPAAFPGNQSQAYGLLANLSNNFSTSSLLNSTDNAFTYQGLILFPAAQWAFQASGDLLHATHQFDPLVINTDDLDRYRAMGRVAANLGPLALGTEVRFNQVNKDFPPLFTGGPDGTGNGSTLLSNSGLLLEIPLDRTKHPSRLWIGGQFGLQLPNPQEKDHFTLAAGGPLVDLTFQSEAYQAFGPEVFLEVPDSLKAALIARIAHSAVDLQQDSSDITLIPSIPSYKLQSADSVAVYGVAKGKMPLEGTLRQKMSLDLGGYLLVANAKSDRFDPLGNNLGSSNTTELQWGIGFGVEKEKDFMMGLQAVLDSQSGSLGPSTSQGFFGYSIAVGGEKWLNAHWALRMGINFENDYNGGDAVVLKPFYPVPPGARVVVSSLSAGVGFQEAAWRSDLTLWTGQPSLYDSPNPDAFATQVGAELSLSFLFG